MSVEFAQTIVYQILCRDTKSSQHVTRGVLLFTFFIFFLISARCSSTYREEYAEDNLQDHYGKIIHSSVLFRHGDRTPNLYFPTLSPDLLALWPEGLGQLNKVGKARMYNLGKWFRKRYKEFQLVINGFDHDLLLMNSSGKDRTMMSGELVLAGFMPPKKDEMWADDGLKWQPIPVHTVPLALDQVIGTQARCDRYELEWYKASNSEKWKTFYKENKWLFDYIAENTKTKLDGWLILDIIDEIAEISDAIHVIDLYNGTLPEWTKRIYPEPMKSLFSTYLTARVDTEEMQRLRGGPILGHIIEDMIQKRNGATKREVHFYSGHDTTIAGLLVILGLFDSIQSGYGAAVIFELRQKNTEYIVTISYRNTTTAPPYLLTLPQCGHVCTLDKFIKLTQSKVPKNWSQECQVGFLEHFFTYHTILVVVILCIILLAIFAAVVFCVLLCVRSIRKLPYEHI